MNEMNENVMQNAVEESWVSPEKNLPEAEELLALIEEKRIGEFRSTVECIPAPDMGIIIEDIPKNKRLLFYRLLPKDQATDVFIEMSSEIQEELISAFSDKELSETFSELYLDDTVDIIEEMPAVVVKRILKNSSPENRSAINQLLRYPKDSAGTIMTTEYVKLSADMTVEAALAHIKAVAIDKETIYTCYVTDNKRRLIGLVTARALMLSERDTLLSDIMEESVIFAVTTEDKEEVANKFNKYGFIALPVVDNEHRLVGIVTVDDAIDVMREEAEEDFAKMAAIIPSETEYLKTPATKIFISRIPWLLLLMISATFSSAILSFFEASLIPVLVLFVPMLMDTGGNSGSQASVTAIRGLSTGEVALSDVFRILYKEIRVGVLCGAALGVVAFGKIMLVDRLIMNNPEVTLTVAFAVSIALTATIIVAKIIGSTLPLLAKRLHLDPAVMASPFITTIVDAVGLILYFLISANVFGLTV
ncbi:MAG: magnesium transporter [Clostridia bacterium]|nr:magnesium transporter [Clostridia bacterium]